jgi:[acyl-carrier-protein] S-malonyltransferase
VITTHAWLFPGQGSQYVGMAADLASIHPAIRRFYLDVEQRIGLPLLELSANGPVEELKRTAVTQPAIYAHSVAIALLLRDRGHRPTAVAGHSLGEYSALAAAGWLDPLDGAALVAVRGALMYQAGLDAPGTMAAVIGMEDAVIESACARASAEAGVVQMANFNSPGQVVISGSLEGIDRALALLKEAGGRLLKKLVVSGAFHSPLMESARQGLLEKLAATPIHLGEAPVYCNVTGARAETPAEVRDLLARQLTEPVRWTQSMRSMASDGCRQALELGPGKVLAGLMKRIDEGFQVDNLDTAADLDRFMEEHA